METRELEQRAKSVRKRIFQFKTKTGAGHLASCLSCVDIVASLYYDEKTLFNPKKDMVVFGKGHGSPSVYPILADLGYFDPAELEKYCTPEGILRLHADSTIPGCPYVGGSLGNALGYAAGVAYKNDREVYVILGDAELYEGAIWESLMFIAHHQICNLHIIVDRNQLGILGATEELLKLDPLDAKFKSFGFAVRTVDGHNFDEMRAVFAQKSPVPEVVIANTIKGKGVSYMEGVWQYHTIIPKDKKLIDTGIEELS